MSKIIDTDYLSESARIRFLENKLVGKEKINRLIETKTFDEALRLLEEFGVKFDMNTDGRRDYEKTYYEMLREAFNIADSSKNGTDIFKILKYQYDCHNIKSCIKCQSIDRDPASIMVDLGSVSAADTIEAVRAKKYEIFPFNMASSADYAVSEYNKTKDPQIIDITLDRGCYLDMLDLANKLDVPFILDAIKRKLDLTNIITALRILRSKASYALFEKSRLPFGQLDEQFFKEGFSQGENAFLDSLVYTPYSVLSEKREKGESMSLAALEKIFDDFYIESLKSAKYLISGAEVIFSYIVAKEYEIRNIRIVIAGKLADSQTDVIRERVRASYV